MSELAATAPRNRRQKADRESIFLQEAAIRSVYKQKTEAKRRKCSDVFMCLFRGEVLKEMRERRSFGSSPTTRKYCIIEGRTGRTKTTRKAALKADRSLSIRTDTRGKKARRQAVQISPVAHDGSEPRGEKFNLFLWILVASLLEEVRKRWRRSKAEAERRELGLITEHSSVEWVQTNSVADGTRREVVLEAQEISMKIQWRRRDCRHD